jgi:translocation and assembly module TamB
MILLLGTGLVAVVLLLASEAGTRLVADQVKNLAGETVHWSALEGTLLGPLRLQGLRLQLEGLDLSIADLYLSWQPRALLEGQVRVDQLAGSGVRLALAPTPESSQTSPFNPGDLALPVTVDLGAITLSDLQVITEEAAPLKVDRIELAARLDGERLDLSHFTVRLPQGGLSLKANTKLAADMPVKVEVSWDWLLAPPGDATAPAPGGPQMVPLSGNLALSGDLQWSEDIGFDLDYRLDVVGLDALESSLPPRAEFTGNARGVQGVDELQLQTVTLALADTPVALSLAGRVTALGAPEPRAELRFQWEGVSWPLRADQADFASARGSASLEGALSNYTLRLAADLGGLNIPESHWTLAARGDASRLLIGQLDGELLGGELSTSGELQWEPGLRWRLEVHGSGLEPSQLRPELTGKLALSLQTDGEIDAEGKPQIDIRLQALNGTLMNFPLEAAATASVRGEVIELVSASLESQGNTLQASGTIADSALDLDWQIDARNPAGLLEGAGGELSASGSVTGSTGKPHLEATLVGSRLRLDNYSLDALKATLSGGLDAGDLLALDLGIKEVKDGETRLASSLQLQGTGTAARHRLNAALDTGDVKLHTRLDGGTDASLSAWQGRLSELVLETADYGKWTLNSPTGLSLAADRASLGETCLQAVSTRGEICIAGNRVETGESEVTGQVRAVPLGLFLPDVSGDIAGRLYAMVAAGGDLRVDGTVTLEGGEVRVDDTRRLAHGGGQMTLQVDDQGLSAQLQLAAPEQGRLEAMARLPALNALPPAADQPLAGSVKAELPDLSGLAAWVPQLGRSAGSLDADLQLGGSLADPRLEGTLALRDGAANLPLAGLEFQDIQLQAIPDPSQPGNLALRGTVRSGPGRLTITGQADLNASAVDLALSGDRFQVYNTPDARALLSTDLQLAWRDDTLTLRGLIAVPQADITPKIRLGPGVQGEAAPDRTVPGEFIPPSPDVVVVSETLQVAVEDEVPEAPFRIDSRLKVQMGDQVQIRTSGFVSRIAGAVDFTNTPDQETLIPYARGRFSLEEGTFRAFGQDLEIETGQLIFADVLATEPEINLRAVRWIDNDPQVTAAGVLATGPLLKPTLELFSRPQLEASEIQSYLLTGRSPRSKESILGIGTYVSPKVYVGYGFNMLEQTSEFNSLFNISPRYGLGSSVGEAANNINVTITYEH